MRFLENRIPPPLVAAGFAVAMWALSRFVAGVDLPLAVRLAVSALALLAAASLGLAGVAGFWRARTTVNPHRPQAASTLVTSGVYRVSRNPMYLAVALGLLALSLWLAFPWSLLGVLGFVLYLNRFQIAPEERALEARFGEDYRRYRAAVRRWL